MEMHQVRYFLATVGERNFTKAAETCNVTQPSLTRAIKQLEEELGGDLFRRERPHAQLTELGQRMYPLLKQCYESALGARELASAIKSGELGTLRLAISRTISLDLLTFHLAELDRLFNRLELKLLRGTAREIIELLAYCEHFEGFTSLIRGHNLDVDQGHELGSERDLITLLESDFGVAFAPRSISCPDTLKQTAVNGLEFRRTIYLYGVAGRERTAAASATLKMLRAANWSRYAS
jgi:DNA-binding MarR family transcriptional regulator